jgi:phospholipid N-methyltransferase
VSTAEFLRDVVRDPLRMGSIVPSSSALARAMVDEAAIGPGAGVLELGAGSGAFTRELVERHPDAQIVAVELSADLAAGLAARFPAVEVLAASADDGARLAAALGGRRVDRVVSGLPWALWSEARQEAVLDTVLPLLAPDARLVTFHYLHSRALGRVRALRRLLRARFAVVGDSAPVWWNFPPAYVHVATGPVAAA